MAIRLIYENEADIPPALKDQYKEQNGKWWLDVEGAVPKSQLDDFRNNNIELRKKLEALETKWGGMDYEQVSELLATTKNKGKDDKDLERTIAERTKKIADDLAAATAARTALEAQLSDLKIVQAAATVATAKKVRPEAMEDLQMRIQKVFRVHEGKVVALDASGQPLYDRTGQPLSVEVYVDELAAKAPHLFEGSSGSGAHGSSSRPGTTSFETNPFKRESWNLTAQGQLYRKNRALAERLAAEAGVKLGK